MELGNEKGPMIDMNKRTEIRKPKKEGIDLRN